MRASPRACPRRRVRVARIASGLAEGGFDSGLGLEQRLSREAARHRFPAETVALVLGHRPSDARGRAPLLSLSLSAVSVRSPVEGGRLRRSIVLGQPRRCAFAQDRPSACVGSSWRIVLCRFQRAGLRGARGHPTVRFR